MLSNDERAYKIIERELEAAEQDIKKAEARRDRLIKALAELRQCNEAIIIRDERREARAKAKIDPHELISQFLEEKCIIDPEESEDSKLIYNAFMLFKAEHGIKGAVAKSALFGELEGRGHICYKGLYMWEPANAIRGLYLRSQTTQQAARRAIREESREPQELNNIIEEVIGPKEQKAQEEAEAVFDDLIKKIEEEPGSA